MSESLSLFYSGMNKPESSFRRILSYDFFRGIISVGLIFFLTFHYFFPNFESFEFFYRWASLGFLFFSGLLIGESIFTRKKKIFFYRKGLQILGIFFLANIFLQIPLGMSFLDFSIAVLKGDYSLTFQLLLPLGTLFLCIPIFSLLPPFLGLMWSLLLFFLLDIVAMEKNIVSLNLFFLIIGSLGFFFGQIASLENLRRIWNEKFTILPYVSLYCALIILFLGQILKQEFFILVSLFWSFHFLELLLFYFSIPSSLFQYIPNTPRSGIRKFFEPLGVEMLFIYVFISLLFEIITRILPEFFIAGGVNIMLFAVHVTIFSFAIITLLHKYFRKNKKLRKVFRFLF